MYMYTTGELLRPTTHIVSTFLIHPYPVYNYVEVCMCVYILVHIHPLGHKYCIPCERSLSDVRVWTAVYTILIS